MIDFGPLPPVGLALPFAVDPESKIFDEVNDQALVVLDRLRLCEHLDGLDLTGFPEWDEIGEWNAAQRVQLLESLAQGAAATTGRKRKSSSAGLSAPPSVARKRRHARPTRER